MKGWNISGLSGCPFWRWLQKKDNYNKENENIIKRGGEKKKIKNSNQYTMGIYGVFCWFYTCFEQKSNPKMVIYIITIAGLFSRKMAHILNQSLFRKKRFKINFFVRQNASKFAIFIEKENPNSFFVFHLEQLSFFPYECPGLCWHRPGHS